MILQIGIILHITTGVPVGIMSQVINGNSGKKIAGKLGLEIMSICMVNTVVTLSNAPIHSTWILLQSCSTKSCIVYCSTLPVSSGSIKLGPIGTEHKLYLLLS